MRMMWIAAVAFAAMGGSAHALEWGRYENDRFGYRVDVPPGYAAVTEADNGDGGIAEGEDSLSRMMVWGANLTEESLADEFRARIESARAEGWDISYRRETPRWASWSGSVDGRIFYARAIALCEGQAAYFLIEYPKARKKAYDPVINRLVKSLKNARAC